jgi:hypothetical protein
MNLEGMLINRRAGLVELRALRLNAHVGFDAWDWISTSSEEFQAKISAIGANLEVLDQDQEAYRVVVQSEINRKISSGQCQNKINPSTGFNDCLSGSAIKFQAWFSAFSRFKQDWNGFLATDPGPSDDSLASSFGQRLKQLRTDYEKISGRKLAVSAAATEAPGGGLFGGAGGVGETAQTLNSIVWLVGLGFAFFIFTTVAAPLLSGAAKTKEQFRQLRS